MFTVEDLVSVSKASTDAKNSGDNILAEKLSEVAQKIASCVVATIPSQGS